MSNIFKVGVSTPKYPDLVNLKPIETSQTELREKIDTIISIIGNDPNFPASIQEVLNELYQFTTSNLYVVVGEQLPEVILKLGTIISAINSGGTGGVSPSLVQTIDDILASVDTCSNMLTGEQYSMLTQIYEAVNNGVPGGSSGSPSGGNNIYPSMQDYAIMQRLEIPYTVAAFPTYIPLIVSQSTYRYYFDGNMAWETFRYQYVSRDTGATEWFNIDRNYFDFDANRGNQVNFCIKMYEQDAYFYFTTYLQAPLPFVFPTIGQHASMQEMTVPAPLKDFPCALVNENAPITVYYKAPINAANMRYAAMDGTTSFEWKTPDNGTYFTFEPNKRLYYMAYTDPVTSKVFYFTVYLYAYR